MDLIYGYVAVLFAWAMLGYFLIPAVWISERGVNYVVKYATVGQYSCEYLHKLFKKLFWKWNREWESWEVNPPQFFISCIIWGTYWVISVEYILYALDRQTPMEGLTQVAFTNFAVVGNFLAPVVLFGGVIAAAVMLSRKVFTIKIKLEEHMENKKVHN